MLALAFLLRLVLVLTPLNREFTLSPVVTALLLILQWLLTLGIALAFLKARSYKLSLQTLGFRRPPSILRALFMAAGFVFLFHISLCIYEQFISPTPQDITSAYTPSLLGFVLAFLQVAIMVPVLEELFFRGIIHQGLEHQFGFLPGAIMSASLFALAHLYPSLYPPIFLLGFLFAYLVHRTGSVWPSIAGHMMVNSLAVIAQFTSMSQGT
jgi:membrane protease YdiL (CAAX protease family)